MNIGRRIYYERLTGNIILDTGERIGHVIPTTFEQDVVTFKKLSELNQETFDYIELEYGQYAQDFAECNDYRVNPETKELEFSYPDPDEPEEPQLYQAPLSEKVTQLESKMDTAILELTTLIAMGGM